MLYNMEIGADLHCNMLHIFGVKMSPTSRRTQRQDVLNVKSVVSSCPASTRSCQDVLLCKFTYDSTLSIVFHFELSPLYTRVELSLGFCFFYYRSLTLIDVSFNVR